MNVQKGNLDMAASALCVTCAKASILLGRFYHVKRGREGEEMGEADALFSVSMMLDSCSLLSVVGWDDKVSFACTRALVWVAPDPVELKIELIGSLHEHGKEADDSLNRYGYKENGIKSKLLPSFSNSSSSSNNNNNNNNNSVDNLWARIIHKILSISSISALTNVASLFQQRILETTPRKPSPQSRDIFQNNISAAIQNNVELPPHKLLHNAIVFFEQVSERSERALSDRRVRGDD